MIISVDLTKDSPAELQKALDIISQELKQRGTSPTPQYQPQPTSHFQQQSASFQQQAPPAFEQRSAPASTSLFGTQTAGSRSFASSAQTAPQQTPQHTQSQSATRTPQVSAAESYNMLSMLSGKNKK
jgi:hypothetical protein